MAVVKHLLKKFPSNLFGSYRLISLISSICEIPQILIGESVMKCLLAHHLTSLAEHGFMSNRSTISQLLLFFNDRVFSFNENVQSPD